MIAMQFLKQGLHLSIQLAARASALDRRVEYEGKTRAVLRSMICMCDVRCKV